MTDIGVTLGLDDRDYKAKLKAAENAAKTFAGGVNTSLAATKNGLGSLSNGVEALNGKFNALSQTLVGVGIAAFAQSLFSAANELKDMSTSLDVNISRLMEMGVAASEAGSSLNGISNMLNKMEIAAGQAADGNVKMVVAFNDLGLSLRDLENQSPDQAFYNLAKSLADIESPAVRAAKSVELFGKGAKGFDFAGYVAGIEQTYGTMDEFGKSQERAAQLSEQLNTNLTLVRAAFLGILEPILNIIPQTTTMGEKMAIAETAAKGLAIGLGVLALGSIVSAIKAIAGAATSIVGAMTGAAAATSVEVTAMGALNTVSAQFLAVKVSENSARVANLQMTIANSRAVLGELAAYQADVIVTAELAAAKRALMIASGQLAAASASEAAAMAAAATATAGGGAAAATAATGWMALLAPILAATAAAGGLYAVYQALAGDDGVMNGGGGSNWISNLLGITKATDKATEVTTNFVEEQKKSYQTIQDIMTKASKIQGGTIPTGSAGPAENKMSSIYKEQADAITKQTSSINQANQATLERLSLSTSLIGASKAETSAIMAKYDSEKKYKLDLQALDEKINAQRAKIAANPAEAQFNGANLVLQAYIRQKEELVNISDALAALTKAEAERTNQVEMTKYFLDAQLKAKDEMMSIENEIADLTATEDEKRLSAIDRMITKEKQLAIAKRQSQLGVGEDVSAEEVAGISSKIDAAYAGIKQKTSNLIGKSREFATGWKKSMKEYVDASTNGAKRAESIFKKATGGMEDAIVNFAKTGKFEWKDFLSTMLEELLRSEIQNVFASMMGGMSNSMQGVTGGGGLSGLLGMVGGGGGNQKQQGSSGGGLSSLIGGISKLFGGGTTNASIGSGPDPYGDDSLGSGGYGSSGGGGFTSAISSFGSGVVDMFDSVTSSIGDLFDGWFATGGSIGAGKFGIVGENGPELVKGPGTVTPNNQLGGGTTNVVYNINAVDAMSFKQLLAQDPSYLYALTQMGAGSIPSRR